MAFENTDMNAFTSDTKIMFNEVLDSVALLHVIRQEVEAEKQRMELEEDSTLLCSFGAQIFSQMKKLSFAGIKSEKVNFFRHQI